MSINVSAGGRRLAWRAILLAAFSILASSAAAQQSNGAGAASGARSKTSEAAKLACRKQAAADAFLGVGRCQNRVQAQRQACRSRVENEQEDALELCAEQFDAREKLCDLIGQAPYTPRIDPSNFVRRIDNPFFPLIPGTRLTYRAESEDGVEQVVVTVTDEKETILGVECTVVRDTVKLDGVVIEDTLDWFAQDRQGNVWYFGEISQTFEDGDLVSLAGSWRAGVDGAKPGIVMKANPRVGDTYRQEFSLGVAEDYARIESVTGNATVPAAACTDCVVTRDLVPLEPDADERKFFARGIGFILEVDPATGERGEELVRIERP